jgi:hypothetical protein
LAGKTPDPAELRIARVETKAQWHDFHRLPFRIYRDDPNWDPPLLLERKLHYSVKHNPFFQHAEADFWLAYRGAEPVGRFSAQIDRLHLERHADATGHFGSLEAFDEQEVFDALLRTAEDWLSRRSITRALGPVTFSMWDQPGLLVEGFDRPPSVMMGHAKPYFASRIQQAGYRRIQDLLAYDFAVNKPLPPEAQRIVQRVLARGDMRVRPLRKDRRHFQSEVALILDIMNDAWSANWGFVPMTQAEIDDIAGILKILLGEHDVAIAEHAGEPAAFALIFPNINEAARDLNGRLAPFGWAKLLWRLKVAGTRTGRMPLMGVRKKFQASAIGAASALAAIEFIGSHYHRRGRVETAELSWILDHNEQVKHIIELVGARAYKRYRIYQRALA